MAVVNVVASTVKQNSDIRRVRGTRLARAFKAYPFSVYRDSTYDGVMRSDLFSNPFGFLVILSAVCPQ